MNLVRAFRTPIATGILAVVLLTGAAAPSFAQSGDQVDASLTIVDDGVVTVDVSASSFATLPYSETASQTSLGSLTFTVTDPRYTKGNWQVTASVTDFSPSFATDIDLVATASVGSISVPPVTLSAVGSPVTVIQAGSQQYSPSYVQYQATINVPAGVAPGTYTSTITVAVTNLED